MSGESGPEVPLQTRVDGAVARVGEKPLPAFKSVGQLDSGLTEEAMGAAAQAGQAYEQEQRENGKLREEDRARFLKQVRESIGRINPLNWFRGK